MDNGLIIDVAFALVLVLGTVFGAKRGLFRSLMALAVIVLALVGASLLTDLLTEPVTDLLMPRAEKSVQEWFDSREDAQQGEQPQIEESAQDNDTQQESSVPLAVTGFLKKLLRFDLDGAVRRSLREAARDAALAAVRTLLGSVVRSVTFALCFILLTVLLRLVTKGVDKVFDLPVLSTINALGGGALGLVESALVMFLVCGLAPKLGVAAFTENQDGTYLLSLFMNHTPRSLLAALLP